MGNRWKMKAYSSDDSTNNPFAPPSKGTPAPYAPPSWLGKSSSSSSSSSVGTSYVAAKTEEEAADGAAASPQQDAQSPIPRMILYTRLINLALSICMILAALLSLLTTDNATTGVLACYVMVFSCLLCCFETHLKQVSKVIAFNFGFMYSAKSRSVFMIFVGTILFSFSLFGKIIGLCMLLNAGFNMYVLCKYPGYEDAQRKDAQAEISDYLAAHPAFAKQMVGFGVKAASDFVAKNPEVAAQAATAVYTSSTANGNNRTGPPASPQMASV